MAPSRENEIRFAKDRHEINLMVNACFHSSQLCFGLTPVAGGTKINSPAGNTRVDSIEGQVMVIERQYKMKDLLTRIEIAVGHTGNWRPCVMLKTGENQPVSLLFDDKMSQESEMLRWIVDALKVHRYSSPQDAPSNGAPVRVTTSIKVTMSDEEKVKLTYRYLKNLKIDALNELHGEVLAELRSRENGR